MWILELPENEDKPRQNIPLRRSLRPGEPPQRAAGETFNEGVDPPCAISWKQAGAPPCDRLAA